MSEIRDTIERARRAQEAHDRRSDQQLSITAYCQQHGPYYSGFPKCPVCAAYDEPDLEIESDIMEGF